ncbi:MAG TPA: ATP-binding cassette domain-containing protein [Solirubrobacteraceae bacterium]|jgi:ABC-type lipoprotein export system ATPase subunit
MTLLALERVSRRDRRGAHERMLLREVSLAVDSGELVAVWGPRHCGRSTLLRVAGGIEPPDAGTVRFAGRALEGSDGALGRGIGYCSRGRPSGEAGGVLDELLMTQLACGVPRTQARARSLTALERVGAALSASRVLRELDGAEAMRVAIARALLLEPALLLVDDPIRGVDVGARDAILALLRSLTNEGIAVLLATDDATGLSGADRALSLSRGELRGLASPRLAPVVQLRRASG